MGVAEKLSAGRDSHGDGGVTHGCCYRSSESESESEAEAGSRAGCGRGDAPERHTDRP
jgi:hypothetical protein